MARIAAASDGPDLDRLVISPPDWVYKTYLSDVLNGNPEAMALDLVFAQTTIPVPKVRRVFNEESPISSDTSVTKCVMDYIHGQPLAEVWPKMSFYRRAKVSIHLRRYIRQLHKINHPRLATPGPLQNRGALKIYLPTILGEICPTRGPFESRIELLQFLNESLNWAQDRWPAGYNPNVKPLSDSEPLILVHADIHPHNIMVGEDDRLWLIDWERSGILPSWFEFVSMREQAQNARLTGRITDFSWDYIIPFVCGADFAAMDWYDSMCFSFDRRR